MKRDSVPGMRVEMPDHTGNNRYTGGAVHADRPGRDQSVQSGARRDPWALLDMDMPPAPVRAATTLGRLVVASLADWVATRLGCAPGYIACAVALGLLQTWAFAAVRVARHVSWFSRRSRRAVGPISSLASDFSGDVFGYGPGFSLGSVGLPMEDSETRQARSAQRVGFGPASTGSGSPPSSLGRIPASRAAPWMKDTVAAVLVCLDVWAAWRLSVAALGIAAGSINAGATAGVNAGAKALTNATLETIGVSSSFGALKVLSGLRAALLALCRLVCRAAGGPAATPLDLAWVAVVVALAHVHALGREPRHSLGRF